CDIVKKLKEPKWRRRSQFAERRCLTSLVQNAGAKEDEKCHTYASSANRYHGSATHRCSA
ncbi:hypothetical protein HAX54_019598, partial [Datura stramonium]|nr:hypothetical protein [Datura stramonium]